MNVLRLFAGLCIFASTGLLTAQSPGPTSDQIYSSHFIVTVNGHTTPVMHAAMNLYFLNFPARKHASVSVTADADDFWAKGVEVQPWRLNIRPRRSGRTITFQMDGPGKISISRPRDFGAMAEMLYLFANAAEKHAPTAGTPGIRYFGTGIHRENIDAAEGDHIYLADDAVVFGSLNIWQVNHVTVSGRGVIVYDGPQNPADDDGWMHKRNWHCIVMDEAHEISIEGITCVVRSRTWQIQMKDSRHVVFNNIKVIGANPGNANGDGMDWLGGGDTLIRDSFFRAADDVFSMETSWDGYGPIAFAAQGSPVTNITVEKSVLSTSISNIVRAGWPEKNFEGGNFLLRDSDVIHMGFGGCGIPFALMEFWADPNGRGQSAGFAFENIRMEDWYSLVQAQQPRNGISGIKFTDVMGLEAPSLVASSLKGSVRDVSFDDVVLAARAVHDKTDLPIGITDGANDPVFSATPGLRIVTSPGWTRPGEKVRFEAVQDAGNDEGQEYSWTFGDGSSAKGQRVSHRFPDADGTLHDASGRFRVLLHSSDKSGRVSWVYQPIIVSHSLRRSMTSPKGEPGLSYIYREAPVGDSAGRVQTGVATEIALREIAPRPNGYSIIFEGDLEVPTDGGYSFLLIANEEAAIDIDGATVGSSPKPIHQVCGLAGMAAQTISAHAALEKGRHHLRIMEAHTAGEDDFQFLWQGPGFSLRPIKPEALSHEAGG